MSSIYVTVTFFFVALNFLFCVVCIGMLRRRRPWPRALGVALCVWSALMLGLFLLQAFAPPAWQPTLRHWFYFPIAVDMVWNLLFLQPVVLAGILLSLAFRRFRPVPAQAPKLSPADLSRRKFVYLLTCGAAPAAALGLGVHGSSTRYDLRVRRFEIPVENLAAELEGFTIAHVSDLHSGIFCGPRRLKIISDATNDLRADLVAVTGDFINHNMAEFPDSLAFLRQLRARHGLFLCEGNHDVIPGPGLVARACAENGFPLLFNSSIILPLESSRLILGGLPWLTDNDGNHTNLVNPLYPERREGDVRILLAHHPHLFDSAAGVDLVLSGHTHGGQIMLGDAGFGPLFFKYWSGRYHRDATTMIVSNGCGDWFPCRIGAPAEIGLLRLVRA